MTPITKSDLAITHIHIMVWMCAPWCVMSVMVITWVIMSLMSTQCMMLGGGAIRSFT